MNIPILIIAWKRPQHLIKLINSLKDIEPRNIYVSIDGPNESNENDYILVNETRKVIEEKIKWDCSIKKKYNKKNLGCKNGVSSAITWFFNQVDEGIIIEEDCLLHSDFFIFAEILLDYYRDNKKVWTITSNNFQQNNLRGDGSYYYGRIPYCWGWATWKDRWVNYDANLSKWEKFKSTEMINNIFTNSSERNYWIKIFNNLKYKNKPDSWAYRWYFSSIINDALTITPNINMANNIGFGDEDATNTKGGKSPVYCNLNKPTNILPLRHPTFQIRSIDADDFAFRNYYYKNIFQRIFGRLKRIIKRKYI